MNLTQVLNGYHIIFWRDGQVIQAVGAARLYGLKESSKTGEIIGNIQVTHKIMQLLRELLPDCFVEGIKSKGFNPFQEMCAEFIITIGTAGKPNDIRTFSQPTFLEVVV